MLPRPRLVCQEPGLRPIGRSPGVPDKSSRGLGSMSRYSAQILICFIAYIFHFFYSSVSLVGNFAGLPVCTVPSDIVHCNQNEAGHQTIKAPSMPCWGETGSGKLSGIYATELVKLTDKMDEICINGKFSAQEPSEWRVFCIPVSNFAVFQHRICTDFRDIGSPGCFEILIRSGIWQLSNLSLKVFFRQLGMKMLKYENQKLILSQIFTFCAPNVVNLSVWFIQLTAWIFLNTWLLVMWLNRVRF